MLGAGVRIEVHLQRPVEYRVGRLSAPERLYIDLLGAVFSSGLVSNPPAPDTALLQRIRLGKPRPDAARIVFELAAPVDDEEYYLTDPEALLIELRPARREGAEALPANAQPGKEHSGEGVTRYPPASLATEESQDEFKVYASESFSDVLFPFRKSEVLNSGGLRNPDRFYFDVLAEQPAGVIGVESLKVENQFISTVRRAVNRPGVVRFVLDLTGGASARLMGSAESEFVTVRASDDPLAFESDTVEYDWTVTTQAASATGKGSTAEVAVASAEESTNSLPELQDRRSEEAATPDSEEGTIQPSSPELPIATDDPVETPITIGLVGPKVVNEIVARVQDEFVTLREIEIQRRLMAHPGFASRLTGGGDASPVPQGESRLLEEMIDLRLMRIRAEEMGLGRDIESTVDAALQNLEAGLSEQEDYLGRQGVMAAEYRGMLREKMLAAALLKQEAEKVGALLEADVYRYYEANKEEFALPLKVELAELFISEGVGGDSDPRETIENVFAALAEGEDFSSLTDRYSSGPTASSGGVLGVFIFDELDPRLQEILRPLGEGEVSGAIEVEGGTQFLRLLRRVPGGWKPFLEVAPEIRARLLDEKTKQALADLRDRLWQEAFVEITPKYREQFSLPRLAK